MNLQLQLRLHSLVFIFLRCVFAQVDPSLTYRITVGGRTTCDNILSVASCGSDLVDLFGVDDNSGRQHFNFVPIPNTQNTYNIMVAGGRDGCNLYLSTASCPSNLVDLFGTDDGSGRQRWVVNPISGGSGAVNIVISGGRDGCNDMLSVADCASGTNLVDMFTGDDGSGHQQFVLTPVSSSSGNTTNGSPQSVSSSSSPTLGSTPQPSSSSQSSTSSSSSSDAGAIAGGVVGAVAAVLIVIGIWWWTRKRQRRPTTEMMVDTVEPFHDQPPITQSSPDVMQWQRQQYVVPPSSNTGSVYESSSSGGGGASVPGAPAGRRNSITKQRQRHVHNISQSTSPSSVAGGGGVEGATESETNYLRRRVEELAAENATLQQTAADVAAPPAYQ